jgi:hypothetical protein
MNRLDQLFQQFLQERTYVNNVTISTREWYECAWKAFSVAQMTAPQRAGSFPDQQGGPSVFCRPPAGTRREAGDVQYVTSRAERVLPLAP